ncbi:MAG: import component protein [Candidatus Aenigmarchaeota archaeon ex4484_56]|nr:MAG: import component protein [Candidatus Aenigmarchaeota archaeon ex4484_56]
MANENEHIASILSYFLVGIIWYFVDEKMKKSKMLKFHSKQALNLFIISIVLSIVFQILFFLFWLGWVVNLVILVLWILGLINAINKKEAPIPIVGGWAEKYLTY